MASFFISRVDTAIDPLLPEGSALRGVSAIAQAAAAYELFLAKLDTPLFQALLSDGAQVQRPLWASTSTKNPAYSDLLYVDTLVVEESVNTLPDPTLEAYADHGDATKSRLSNAALRQRLAAQLGELAGEGVDLATITTQLENEGVAAFVSSYDELLATVASKIQKG